MKKRILSLVLCAAMLLSMCLFLGAGVTEATSDTPAETTEAAESATGFGVAGEFTEVAPFYVPTSAANAPARLRSATINPVADTPVDNSGVETSKTAVKNANGGYDITLETYTTGSVTTTTNTKPTDIVLVLDVSGSMDEAYSYIAVTGGEYSYEQRKYYGFGEYDSTYYIKLSNGNYQKVTYAGYDDRNYDCYYYYSGWKKVYVYPELAAGTSNNREYDYDVVQFYKIDKTKLDALKTAVNSFIDSTIAQNAEITNAADQHRISIVKFAGDSSDNIGNDSYYDSDYKEYYNYSQIVTDLAVPSDSLKTTVNGLKAAGATSIDYGMAHASTVLSKSGSGRNKVVIAFTDGSPTHGSEFNTDVADAAIGSAKTLKESGTTVYTICIDQKANVNPGGNLPTGNTNINRFMHLLSSNYPHAQSMKKMGDGGNTGVLQADGTYKSYYLTPNNGEGLSSIFQQISTQIGKPTTSLGSSTVVRDIVSPYFTVPADASQVTVTSVACTGFTDGKPTWDTENAQTLSNAVTISNSTIEVTGFDFDHNFVAENGRDENNATAKGTFHGRKLVISFTVTPKAGFLGGNNVPTNGADSGVYSGDELVENFVVPTVNVPIPSFTVGAAEKNVYLLGNLTQEQLLEGSTITVGTTDITPYLNDEQNEYWQDDYVTITRETEQSSYSGLTDDTTYTVTVTVSPKETATETTFGGAEATKKTNSGTAAVNVYKPVLTYKDSEVYYGEAVPTSYTSNLESTVWKHGETEAPASMGPAPTLTMIYTPEAAKIDGGKINTRQDVGVDVTVKIDETDVADKASFVHTNCEETTCKVPDGCEFVLHVKTCSLTISKTVSKPVSGKGANTNQTFVFDVKDSTGKVVTTVVLKGGEQKVITGLAVGTYTVEEDANWSWSFKADNAKQTVTLGRGNTETNVKPTATVSVVNTFTQPNWLTSIADVINKWETKDGTAAITPIWPKN